MSKLRVIKRILILTIGAITFSGCTSLKVVHVPIEKKPICEFVKFTEAEKASMLDSVGRKIFENQQNCRIDRKRIYDLIDAHNEAHK